MFKKGIDIEYSVKEKKFIYGEGVSGPEVEKRKLETIRESLLNENAKGPEFPYVIAMDVSKDSDQKDLISRNLLLGAVAYSDGKIGKEPVRSQGHIHSELISSNYSTPEVYEIWEGEAIIYMQEYAEDAPGRCYAVKGKPGDIIIVPPYWVHATINADPKNIMVFGAWCIRNYEFEYDKVREHQGIAYYPVFDNSNELTWIENKKYNHNHPLEIKKPRTYLELNVKKDIPIYKQYENNPSTFNFVTEPQNYKKIWMDYIP